MSRKMNELLMMAAMMGGMGMGAPEPAREIDYRPREKPLPNGCQRYHFGEFTCVASSEKAAEKKYQKWLSKRK